MKRNFALAWEINYGHELSFNVIFWVRSYTGMDGITRMDYRNGLLYVTFGDCNVFYMHIMAHRSHKEYKIRVACILGTAKIEIDLLLWWLFWGWGEGLLVQNFLRHKVD